MYFSRGIFIFLALITSVALFGCDEEAPTRDASSSGRIRDCRVPVFFSPDRSVETLAVVGDYNDWGRGAEPLHDADGDGVFAAVIDPGEGLQRYRISADGTAYLDPYNPLTMFGFGGSEHSVVRVPGCDVPELRVESMAASAEGDVGVSLEFWRAVGGAALQKNGVRASLLRHGQGVEVEYLGAQGEDISLKIKSLPPGKYTLQVSALDADEKTSAPLLLPFWIEETPFDWKDALIYQIFVDRFRVGGGALDEDASISFYHGGDLWGVIEAIEEGYFKKMGVNALWISPMYRNPEGDFSGRDGARSEAYHGYWPAASREVSARFGGEAALEALVSTAHAHGIRVIVDAVINHVHTEHSYWRDHNDWFNNPDGDCICGVDCSWGTHIKECWFDPFLADLDWRKEEVVEQLIDDALWWVERFDLDGLRMDAVPMMPRLAIRHLRDRVTERFGQGGHDLYLLGETYTQRGDQNSIAYYIGPHSLSGQFDFPVMWALRDALAGRIDMTDLDAEVVAGEVAWEGSGAVMAPLLGNHDVPRFVSDVNGDPVGSPRQNPPPSPDTDEPHALLTIGWTFLLSLPGAPVIYYGDELGLPGANDPDNRRNMKFEPELDARERLVKSHVERLGRVRACSRALRRGERKTLRAGRSTYVFGRDAGDGAAALTFINAGPTTEAIFATLPAEWGIAEGVIFTDVLGHDVHRDGARITVTLPPRSSALLLTETACLR